MKHYSLKEFVKQFGQLKAAEIFGVNQSAISKALRSNREITVTQQEDGGFIAKETRPFPHKEKPTAEQGQA